MTGRVHILFGSVYPLISAPGTAALARGLIGARYTRPQPRRALLQVLVVRKDLRDQQRFTPPVRSVHLLKEAI
jgi:hypothetical protein